VAPGRKSASPGGGQALATAAFGLDSVAASAGLTGGKAYT